MAVLENYAEWEAAFREGWLAHYRHTGEFDWQQYPCVRNGAVSPSSGIDLARSRLMLVSSGGFYVRERQAPFDAANPLGDYSTRLVPMAAHWDAVAIAHEHYDHTAVEQDPQVLVPLRHLNGMVADGRLGELAPSIVTFMGYQPDVTRVVDETAPAVVEAARAEEVDAVLLVPA
jgi:D-proline reductase (dithiol) PrdB